jgi:hypothetical protein
VRWTGYSAPLKQPLPANSVSMSNMGMKPKNAYKQLHRSRRIGVFLKANVIRRPGEHSR